MRWGAGALFAAAGRLPAAIGGAVPGRLPAGVLTGAFAVTAALAALRTLWPPASVRHDDVPVRRDRAVRAGAGLGVVTGVLGVGGFLAVPALVNVVGLRRRAAVGTSLLVITVNSLVAPATRAGSAARVDWAAVGPFAAAAVLDAP